jgi:outer membrane protein
VADLSHNLLDRDIDLGMVFAIVLLPISSWWGGSHAIQREKYNEMKAENQKLNMREFMAVDIGINWNDLHESYFQFQIAQKSIESANENLNIVSDYYHAGTVSLTDLADSQ